ncbi:MAG: transcription-repair coupling factor [Phycisphaerales bacterium]|nr:transcription-repair coupling factor [Phycisphaerales bacterium]
MTLSIRGVTDDSEHLALARRIDDLSGGVVHVGGLWGSSAPMTAALLARHSTRIILYVTAHLEEADHALDDAELFAGSRCMLFPAWEARPGEGAGGAEIEAERLRVLTLIDAVGGEPDAVRERNAGGDRAAGRRREPDAGPTGSPARLSLIVAPIQALMQPTPPRSALRASARVLTVGDEADPLDLLAWCVEHGYERLELVESPGDAAQRGDIFDVFPPGEPQPMRVQFLGDRVEAIRRFDVGTQRSGEALRMLTLTAMKAAAAPDLGVADLISYLPDDAVVVLDNPSEIGELAQTYLRRLEEGRAVPGVFPVEDVFAATQRLRQVHLSRFGSAAVRGETTVDFGVRSVTRFEGKSEDAVAELLRLAQTRRIHVICENDGERDRLRELLAGHRGESSGSGEAGAASKSSSASERACAIELHLGRMHRGFEWTRAQTMVLPHHEIFHRYQHRRRLRRVHTGRAIESWVELKSGEYVVHATHGIALFTGMETMRKGESAKLEEFLVLEFAEGAKLFVPTSQVDLVQKYIGAGGHKPVLSTLGGKRWKKTKERVAAAVEDMADSLLRLQAMRTAAEGTAYPADTPWQREFENAFPYEETEDQIVVARELKDDLCRPRPMDRLVCGDVGYGKTELAMRAAFKVVEHGRQVAVLVPTTILAEQHYETFRERFADYPFVVGCLSRFRTGGEQKKLIEAARKGHVDVVIGTHRLLSKDVGFADLGMVVIDEEQRFGVEHKERLKQLRETVDVVTLSATPIPRTLHMAMTGLRDISTLQTPPMDRRSIATQVVPFSDGLVREAVLRELNREGQVFFVHNYVRSIHAMADHVRAIVPDARVLYGHGQMHEHELEDVMFRFAHREADVLVCTTIIESGIDIPSANTIFINHADRFGLADLHQLRGRVGRSKHRGYCYLLLPQDKPARPKAVKRLKAIEEFSDLGAGFRIAMRDLEIRGAGNLLGAEQSGHIAAVGYDLYCKMLEQTVRRMKNEPDPLPPPVHLELEVVAHIPESYIGSERARIEAYRRIASCPTLPDLQQLERDLADAFGSPPKEVTQLMELVELRVRAAAFGIRSIILRRPDVVFTIGKMSAAQAVFEGAPGTVRMPDAQTVHLRLPPKYMEPGTLTAVLRRMMVKAATRASGELVRP